MKRNFLTLFILVLVIAFATCFMITGCKKDPEQETPQSSIDTDRKSVPKSVDDGSDDPTSVTSTPDTPTSTPDTPTSSDDGGSTSSDDSGTTSSDDGGETSSEPDASSSKEDVRPSDTPIYNSGN